MNIEKSILVLNNLIEINKDRIQVFETATTAIEESDLKVLFCECQKTSKIFQSELAQEVQKMGGSPVDLVKNKSFFTRLCTFFKKSLIDKDREDILNSLEQEESVVIKSYNETLASNFDNLTADLVIIVKSQQILLTAQQIEIRKLGHLMLN